MRRFLCLLLCTSCLISTCELYGQLPGNELLPENRIAWIGQYPPEGKQRGSLFEKLGSWIVGEKTNPLVKPVGAIKFHNDLWILGQGDGSVYKIGDRKIYTIEDRDQTNFPSLVSICALKDSGVLVTDSFLDKAFFIRTGSGEAVPFNSKITLNRPTGIAYCPITDRVWIVETGAHRISIFNTGGSYIKSIGERGSLAGTFNFPTHITIDNMGNAYVVDALNYRIQVFDKSGELLSAFGKQGQTTGTMARPKGIATDSQGNIYVADALFHCVQVFNREGELLYYFGDQGTEKEQFWMPSGLFIDEKDHIYVCDTYNNRIQIYQKKTAD